MPLLTATNDFQTMKIREDHGKTFVTVAQLRYWGCFGGWNKNFTQIGFNWSQIAYQYVLGHYRMTGACVFIQCICTDGHINSDLLVILFKDMQDILSFLLKNANLHGP